jgi:hypothetical protein
MTCNLYHREVPSKTIFACKQTRDKQDGRIILNTCCKEIWLNVIIMQFVFLVGFNWLLQDAIFLTHSEILSFLGIFIKED